MAEETVELNEMERDDDYGTMTVTSVEDQPAETEMIKARIEETRKEMGETIDAIQERLSIANISEQVSETVSSAIETAKDTAYDATIGKAVTFMKDFGNDVTHSKAFRTVRNNPFPLALIGLGAGLLAYQAFGNRGSRYGDGRGRRQLTEGNERSTSRDSSRGFVGRAYDGISQQASDTMDTVSGKANSAYESVSGAIGDAYSGANDAAHRAYDRLGEYGTAAYDRLGEYGTAAHDKYDEYIEENPLAVGAVALAVGAAVGFAIPPTKVENRLMGETRDDLMQRAQDAAGTLVEKAKKVATDAGRQITEETKSLGH